MEDRSAGNGAQLRFPESAAALAVLVRAAQAGEARAVDELVTAHLPLIYNLIGRALGGHADVDDVVQETMIRAVRSLPELREPERFRSWLVAIAYRQIQQHLRDRRKALLRRQELTPELPDPHSDFTQRTIAELELTGQRRELAEAVRWLDDGDRQLLSLWWQEAAGELTRGELAAAMALRRQHVAVRLQRLRIRLDEARVVVRALHAEPRCPELSRLLQGWGGRADARWRKRLTRHTRDCPSCGPHRHGLVAPEDLLLAISSLPLPAAAAEALRAALDAAASTVATSATTAAGQSIVHTVLTQLQSFAHNKTATAATAAAVAAGGGLVYAVHESPAPVEPPQAITAPTAAPTPPGGPAPAPSPAPAAGPTPTPRAATTGVSTADVYVAPDGSDDGDGSIDRPFATLGRAVAEVRPGETIALRGGTYYPSEGLVIDIGGEPERRITLSNYRDERPVIDASQVPADQWAITHRGSYWTVQGLEIRNSRSHAYVCTSCRENIFWRMSFHDNARSGLTLRDPGTIGNQVLDSDFYRNYDPAGDGRAGIGLGIKFGSGTGNLIHGCRAFHNADTGFDVGYFEDPVTLEHNWAFGNGVNRWGAADWRANADGFRLGSGDSAPAAAHLVRHNAAWDNVAQGFSDGDSPATLHLSNNTAFRNGAAGFHLTVAAAELRDNVAVGNAPEVRLGDSVQSGGNTWDGGDWNAAMFRSTDPTAAEGQREPDGSLAATDFLVSDAGIGAAMRRPAAS